VSLQYCNGGSPVVLPVVTVVATDATAGEPGSGQGSGTFTFARTGVTTDPLTVNFTVGGTATGGSDYTSSGTSVNFAAGSATATVTVNILDDTVVEGDETVVLTLASGSGYTVGSPSSATVTIKDDDSGGCVLTNLVSGFNLGTVRSNYSGWVGTKLQVGATPLNVQSLGRVYRTGNTQNHELRLVAAAGGATVASVFWTPAGGVNDQISYAALAAPVTLAANAIYYLASKELSNGDTWRNAATVLTTSAAAALSAIYSPDGNSWTTYNVAGTTYGPVSLQYCIGGTTTLTAAGTTAKSPLVAERSGGLFAPPTAKILLSTEGQMQLLLSGQAGQHLRILASEKMSDWSSIGEATIGTNGNSEFTDTNAFKFENRFYILRSP